MPLNDFSGFILAGGRSRRMGQDKSRLAWGDGTFLNHAIHRMQQVCGEVFIVGRAPGATVPVFEDEFPGNGPLAALHTALRHSTTEWNLVLAVDMPLVPPALLRFLSSRIEAPALVVLPQVATTDIGILHNREMVPTPRNALESLQPLCAVYHRQFLPLVRYALSNRELSIRRLLERTAQGMMNVQSRAIRIIDQHELSAAGFDPEMLMNVNTPRELEHATKMAEHFDVE